MKGKVAIVTASSTGIGKSIVECLGEDNCTVIVSSRNQQHIDQTVSYLKSKSIDAYGIVCDVGIKQHRTKLIQETVQKYGRLDYLVANAVSAYNGKFMDIKEHHIRKMWQINYTCTFLLIQQAVPYLQKQPNSAIVIISSLSGYQVMPMISHYGITKTALIAMTKTLAQILLNDNIRVNAIAPGIIKTKFSESLWKNDEKKTQKFLGVKRLGVTRDIGNVAHFLLSDYSSYMTGQCLFVAGRPTSRL